MPFLKNILLTNSSTIYGGGEYYVLELAKHLAGRGYNITVSCKPNSLLLEKLTAAGIDVAPLEFPPQGQLVRFVNKLMTIIKERNIHLVHSNSNYDRTAGGFAAVMEGIPHATNVHSFHSLRSNLTHSLRNRFATQQFIVDGFCVKEMLVRDDGIPGEKISVVHLGVDHNTMKRDTDARSRIRREFGCTDDNIVIGNVARFVPFKGQEYAVRAFAQISAAAPAARLLLIGDGELLESMKTLAAELGVGDKVLFAGFRDDLVAVYSAFDVYVHPSIEGGGETFPFAVLQSLAEELPAVVTKVGDVPYMVEEGSTGFVVPEKDPPAIAAKLQRLTADAQLRAAMGKRSRELLLRNFTLPRMVDGIEGVYRAIAETTVMESK